METILITGGSGFLASHIILQALEKGYIVRTTIRNLAKKDELTATLKANGTKNIENLSFYQADLLKDDGWQAASDGCDYVLHTASPFPMGNPKNEDDLIVPAVEGTLRALKSAHAAKVKRVVVTSSFAAIGYGHGNEDRIFDENDWTDVNAPDASPYFKSKTLAERAAWDYIAGEGKGMELATVNPVAIFGPTLGTDFGTSIGIIKMLLNGEMPALPRIHFGVVDVRDVAELHLLAMTDPKANGQRFLATAGTGLYISQIAKILRDEFGEKAYKVPKTIVPDFMVKIMALFIQSARDGIPHLGKDRKGTSDKAIKTLNWQPKSEAEAIIATAKSLFDLGIVK